MASDDYTTTPPTGKLKLKGVKDSKIGKKKRSKKSKYEGPGGVNTESGSTTVKQDEREFVDKSIALQALEEEKEGQKKAVEEIHEDVTKNNEAMKSQAVIGGEIARRKGRDEDDEDGGREQEEGHNDSWRYKTEAERRYEDQRRRRLDERLKREGIKTHKQRVEELNRYLSGLSEHHDMPRIGPG